MNDEQLTRTMREIIDMASRTAFKEARCTDEAVNLAKAYADAMESKEIAELKAHIANNLLVIKGMNENERQITEINSSLESEIKRLREFAHQCFKSPEKLAVIHFFENGEFDYCDLAPLQDAAINSLSPAPVTEDKFSVSAYPKECSPTIEQLTETDDLTMMQRLGKRMPPFHGVAPVTEAKNEDQV